jgi:hypothetical protein
MLARGGKIGRCRIVLSDDPLSSEDFGR